MKYDYISLIALISIVLLTLSSAIIANNSAWSFYGIVGGIIQILGTVGFPLAIMVTGYMIPNSGEDILEFYKKVLKVFAIPVIVYLIICNQLSHGNYNKLWYTSIFIGIVICAPFLNIFLNNISDKLLKILVILIIVARSYQIFSPLFGKNIDIDLWIFNNWMVFYIIGNYLTRITSNKIKNSIYKLGIISFIITFLLRSVNIDFNIFSVSPTLILYSSAVFLKLKDMDWEIVEKYKYIYRYLTFMNEHKLGMYILHNYVIINLLQDKFNLNSNRFKVVIGCAVVFTISFVVMSFMVLLVDKYIIPTIYTLTKFIINKFKITKTTLFKNKYYIIWFSVSWSVTLLIEIINRGSIERAIEFVSVQPDRFIINFMIVLVTTSPCLLFKRMYMILTIICELLIILSIVSYAMSSFRGTPLTYSDFYAIQDGVGIAKQYLNIWIIIGILVIILLFGLLAYKMYLYKVDQDWKNKIVSIIIIIISIISMDMSINKGLRKGILVPNQWDLKLSYDDNGFIYSIYNSYNSYKRKRPEAYTKDNINKIKNNISNINKTNKDNENPNIIIVQLESVIDPMRIEGIKFSRDPIKNIREISEKYSSGMISVPTFGGGTARTEFEVLTGINLDYLSPGEIPHNSILKKQPVESLAYVLNNEEYEDTLIHNYEGSFYGRNKAYENLGIKRYIPLEYMYNIEYPYAWPSDNLILDNIKDTLESTEKRDLILALAVQTHGGYRHEYENEDSEVKITGNYPVEKLKQLQDFVDDLVMVDEMIGQLVEYVENLDEPTILAVYSDHLPSLDLVNENIKEDKKYLTEYFICDNMGLKKQDKDIETYELSTEILNRVNMEGGVINKFHNAYRKRSDYEENLELIQYDLLSGNKYMYEGKEIYEKTNIELGLDQIIIEDVKIASDKVTVIGTGFNQFSKVYIDGKSVETEYINDNKLVCSASSKQIKDVAIHQESRYQKSIGSTKIYLID